MTTNTLTQLDQQPDLQTEDEQVAEAFANRLLNILNSGASGKYALHWPSNRPARYHGSASFLR